MRWPLVESLASAMFMAEYGYTGITWSSIGDDYQNEWKRRASRVLEAWSDSRHRYVVFDLREDEMWLAAAVPEPEP